VVRVAAAGKARWAQALAHAVGSRVRSAIARTDLLERRRDIMEAWGGYLGE